MPNSKTPFYKDENELQKVRRAVESGAAEPTAISIAKYIGTSETQIRRLFRHFEITKEELVYLSSLALDPEAGIKHDKSANRWVINSRVQDIHTLDALLNHCKADLEIWEVERWIANAWEVSAKSKKENLKFSKEWELDKDGNKKKPRSIKEGEVFSDGEMIKNTNIQIKVWLRRINPKAIMPVIHSVQADKIFKPPKVKRRRGVQRSLQIADPQMGFRKNIHTGELIPFHDRRVLDIASQIMRLHEFDDLTLTGDNMDLPEFGKYLQEPEFYFTTQPTILEMYYWLREWRELLPKAVMDLFNANHEDRLNIAMATHFRAAYDLRAADELELPPALSLPRLLALHDLGIGWISDYPDGIKWLSDNFAYQHGKTVRGSGDTAKAVSGRYSFTVGFGHIHRRELVSRKKRDRNGHTINTAFSPGCACHIDGRVPGSSVDHEWQQGLGIYEYIPDRPDIDVHIIPVEIDNGIAIYNGEIFEARDRNDEIDGWIRNELQKIESY